MTEPMAILEVRLRTVKAAEFTNSHICGIS